MIIKLTDSEIRKFITAYNRLLEVSDIDVEGVELEFTPTGIGTAIEAHFISKADHSRVTENITDYSLW